MTVNHPIDFVIPWVDGKDPAWLREKNSFLPEQQQTMDASDARYRDWDNLKYWFRAVEKYAPWVHKVYFITWGHVPEWLKTESEKIVIVRHEDYIPKKYLPVFSSHPIELNMHRIPGLSEHFVYFNDDLFLTAPVKPEDFFRDGLPCDCLLEKPIEFASADVFNNILVNNAVFMNRFFSRTEVRKRLRAKRYPSHDPRTCIMNAAMETVRYQHFFGLEYYHAPQPFLKSVLEEVWEKGGDTLDQTCHNRFRSMHDVNQYVFREWQLLTGKFYPVNRKKTVQSYHVGSHTDLICKAIREQTYLALCINDSAVQDFESTKKRINDAFEAMLKEKCSFEK